MLKASTLGGGESHKPLVIFLVNFKKQPEVFILRLKLDSLIYLFFKSVYGCKLISVVQRQLRSCLSSQVIKIQ